MIQLSIFSYYFIIEGGLYRTTSASQEFFLRPTNLCPLHFHYIPNNTKAPIGASVDNSMRNLLFVSDVSFRRRTADSNADTFCSKDTAIRNEWRGWLLCYASPIRSLIAPLPKRANFNFGV